MPEPTPSLTPVPPPPAAVGIDFGGQIAAVGNTFVDPPSVAPVIPTKLSWLLPLVLACAANIAMALVVSPIAANVFRMNPPEGMAPEQVQRAIEMMEKFAWIGLVTAPLGVIIMTLIAAGLTMAACAITGVDTKFARVFSIVSYGSLIQALGAVAGAVVLKAKAGDIQSMQELAPRFGLDLLIHDVPKAVLGLLRFCSIFTIWEMIVMVIIASAALKVSKGKAFGLTLPMWVLMLLFAVGGTMLQK